MSKLGIDFDGTICQRSGIPTQGRFQDCPPVDGALEGILALIYAGHTPYILTQRTGNDWPKIRKWLRKYGFPKLEVTNKKLSGTIVYLDDRAVRFTNWKDFCKLYL